MQDLNTNSNQADLLVLVFDFGRTLTKNFCEYLQAFRVSIYLVHSHSSIYLWSCFNLKVLMGNTHSASFNI